MLGRLTAILVLAILISGCSPSTYYLYKGEIVKIEDEGVRDWVYVLHHDGGWVEANNSVLGREVATDGRKLTAAEANKMVAQRRCASGNCRTVQQESPDGASGEL